LSVVFYSIYNNPVHISWCKCSQSKNLLINTTASNMWCKLFCCIFISCKR